MAEPQAKCCALRRLSPAGLNGAVRYYDGFTNDARLTSTRCARPAESGASSAELLPFQGRVARRGLGVRAGGPPGEQSTFKVRARAVVNATGPWAEGLPHSRVKLRLTKGVHLVVERARCR